MCHEVQQNIANVFWKFITLESPYRLLLSFPIMGNPNDFLSRRERKKKRERAPEDGTQGKQSLASHLLTLFFSPILFFFFFFRRGREGKKRTWCKSSFITIKTRIWNWFFSDSNLCVGSSKFIILGIKASFLFLLRKNAALRIAFLLGVFFFSE